MYRRKISMSTDTVLLSHIIHLRGAHLLVISIFIRILMIKCSYISRSIFRLALIRMRQNKEQKVSILASFCLHLNKFNSVALPYMASYLTFLTLFFCITILKKYFNIGTTFNMLI